MNDGRDWTLTERARRRFDALDDDARERVSSKLDNIVDDSRREPPTISNRFECIPPDTPCRSHDAAAALEAQLPHGRSVVIDLLIAGDDRIRLLHLVARDDHRVVYL